MGESAHARRMGNAKTLSKGPYSDKLWKGEMHRRSNPGYGGIFSGNITEVWKAKETLFHAICF